jgi:hypothetical protein
VKLAPDGTYTKNLLARKMAEQYGVDPMEVQRVVKQLITTGALLWQQDPSRKQQRKRLFRGTMDASRARVRERAMDPVGPPRSSDLPKPAPRRKARVKWI